MKTEYTFIYHELKRNALTLSSFLTLLLALNNAVQAQPEVSYKFDNLWGKLNLIIEYPINDLKNADSIIVWQSASYMEKSNSSIIYQGGFQYVERSAQTLLDAKAIKAMNDMDTLFISFQENNQQVYLTYLLPSEVEYIRGGSQYFYRVKKDYIQVRIIIDKVGPLSGATQMFIFENNGEAPTGYHIIQNDDNLLRVYEIGNFAFLESGENLFVVNIYNEEGQFFTFLIQYDPGIKKFRVNAKDQRLDGEGVIRLFSESGR